MNIPDFVNQLQEAVRPLFAQADVTEKEWQDDVQKRFYETYVEKYRHYIDLVLYGQSRGQTIYKYRLDEMLSKIDGLLNEMSSLSGIPADVQFEAAAFRSWDGSLRDNYNHDVDVEDSLRIQRRGGKVYDEYLERDYWDEHLNGSNPGHLDSEDIHEIMKHR